MLFHCWPTVYNAGPTLKTFGGRHIFPGINMAQGIETDLHLFFRNRMDSLLSRHTYQCDQFRSVPWGDHISEYPLYLIS